MSNNSEVGSVGGWKGMRRWASASPSPIDVFFLSLFVAIITLQPFYLHGQLNLFELGLYLPGIDAVLHGQIPYRDFFYLRGPFELYMPAVFMRIFGENVRVLSTYFFAGNVLALMVCVLLAKEILRSRGFLYLLVPVLVARTFPRVVFTFWGGMRFALGLLAIYCAVRYFKKYKMKWIVCAGILTAWSALTSIEIGVSACAGIAFVLILQLAAAQPEKKKTSLMALAVYGAALASFLIFYSVYLAQHQAVAAYLDVTWSVLKNMTKVFIQTEPVPGNFFEIGAAMLNPANKNFQHTTPVYTYLAGIIYCLIRMKKDKLSASDWGLVILMGYGFVMYCASFRNLWANAFEMALQPEKIVLFVLLERTYAVLREKSEAYPKVSPVVIAASVGIILSSVIYPINHFQKRFFTFQFLTGKGLRKLKPMADQDTQTLHLTRISGMVVPYWQARDLNGLQNFLDVHTRPGEPVLMFPEMGTYYFVTDRPWVGRFPMVSMSWINDRWHAEFMESLRSARPRYAVIPKKFPDHFYYQYFKVAANKRKFDEVMDYVGTHYKIVASTPSLNIFLRTD